jgi:hypothetical protein
MSEESFHSEHPGGWIEWFCSHEDHLFLCEVDEDFIKDPQNSFDFKDNYHLFEYHHYFEIGMLLISFYSQRCLTPLSYKTLSIEIY